VGLTNGFYDDYANPEESISFQQDGLDDYIEDFFLPLSHETIMSRQKSFRMKVQKQLESAAAETAEKELDRFDAMLATYDEEEEYNHKGIFPTIENQPPVPKARSSTRRGNNERYNREQQRVAFDTEEPPSLALDIDAIVKENAPNLMSPSLPPTVDPGFPGDGHYGADESMLSNYFLPQPTLDKLYAVYESSNFNNLYCLSGELKNMLSSSEIEEIVANKEHLEKFIDPNVMAALSWSLNEASLPTIPLTSDTGDNNRRKGTSESGHISPREGKLLESKSSSLSHGFHSDASLDSDDTQSNNENDDVSSSVSCGSAMSSNGHHPRNSVPIITTDDDLNNSRSSSGASSSASNSAIKKVVPVKDRKSSGNSLNHNGSNGSGDNNTNNVIDDLGLGFTNNDVEWDDEGNDPLNNGGIYLARRDSKRCSRKKGVKNVDENERVIEGLFVESKNPNPKGTLRRIKVPMNLAQDEDEAETYEHLSLESPVDSSLTDDEGIFCLL